DRASPRSDLGIAGPCRDPFWIHRAALRWPRADGVPDTGQNTLMLPKCALSAPRQCKPLESHDLDTTARVHHAARRRGSVAARGARAAGGDAGDWISLRRVPRGDRLLRGGVWQRIE